MVGGGGAQLTEAMVQGPFISLTGNKKMGNMLQRANQKDLIFMKELLENGKVKPVIDRTYNLSEAHEALKYFEEGHSQGKVIITM
jgi:NADPH:quinone reductase-like Zn-dependent oxidoreductase